MRNKLEDKFRKEYKRYKYQMIGGLLLFICYLLAFLDCIIPAIAMLVFVGFIDIELSLVNQITTRQWLKELTSKTINWIIIGGLIILCGYFKGVIVALWFALGLLQNYCPEKEK